MSKMPRPRPSNTFMDGVITTIATVTLAAWVSTWFDDGFTYAFALGFLVITAIVTAKQIRNF